MKPRLTIFWLAAAGWLLAESAWCLGGGTGNSAFTQIAVGARPAAMGQAFAAVANDADANFWNPAGLTQIDRPQIRAMHLFYLADINLETAALAFPSSRVDSWGFSTVYLWQPPFDSTQNDFGIPVQSAAGTGSDLALTLGYAHNFGNFHSTDFVISNISAGANLRLISSSLQGQQASAIQVDLGGMAEPFPGFRTALVVQNLGTTATYINDADPSVANVRAGVSYQFSLAQVHRFVLDFDLNHPVDASNPNFNRWRQNFGLEYWLFNTLALRGGYMGGYDVGGLTAGMGFRWNNIGLDYAFVPYSDLGDTHRISLDFSFGNPIPRPEVAAPNAPTGLTGTAGDHFVLLGWQLSPESDVVGYNVYYTKTSGHDYVRANDQPISKAARFRIQLENNQTYYFVVTAVNGKGKESDFSDEISLTPFVPRKPGAPRDLRSRVMEGNVELTWQPSNGADIAGYNVYYAKAAGEAYRKLTRAGLWTEPRCFLKGLKSGLTYRFVVTAVTRDGVESAYSNGVSAVPHETRTGLPKAHQSRQQQRENELEQPF